MDQFTIEILGDAKGWAQVDPAVVNLLPDGESTVVVLFRPPRSADLAAGNVPLGIRVSSREDRAATVIEEGTLRIEAFTDVRIELVPRRAWGRRQAKIEVAVDNLGNHPATLAIESTATEAANKRVQQVAETANAAKAQADEAVRVATGAAPGAPTSTTPAPPSGPGAREPIDFRIAADAPRAGSPDDFTAFEATLPADRAVLVSDLVLQNPFGDSGIIRLLRVVDGEETILLAVNCQNPPAPSRDRCTPSASFSGVSEA